MKKPSTYQVSILLYMCAFIYIYYSLHSKLQYALYLTIIVGRIGKTNEALQIIIHDLKDISLAINFCQENNDLELWDGLIEHSLNKPNFIIHLLKAIGAYVDPQRLVQRIAPDLVIPNLKDALVKMMCDYNLQVCINQTKYLTKLQIHTFKKTTCN